MQTSRDNGGIVARISNSSPLTARVRDMVKTISMSYSGAAKNGSKILTVSAGKRRLRFYMNASRKTRTLRLSVSFFPTISRSSSKPSQRTGQECYSQIEGLHLEKGSDLEKITSLFLSALRDGNSTCSRGDASRFAHKFVGVWKNPNTGSVLIYNQDGCISVMLDHSGNVLYSWPSIQEIGIDPSSLNLRMTRSKQEKQIGA